MAFGTAKVMIVRFVQMNESEKLLGSGLQLASYKIRLAQTDADRDEVYRMRFKVFNEELGSGIAANNQARRDIDEFDKNCDHLVIEKNKNIVGTYRLLPGYRITKEHGFFSETEFNIGGLPINFEKSLEMGRACILPEHRKQATLVCLFVGIRHCMNLRGCTNLFGLASLAPMSHANALATFYKIKDIGRTLEIPNVKPISAMAIPYGTVPGPEPHIPALLSIYFGLGAFVCAEPAYDPVFKTHDMLTLLRLEEIPERSWDFLTKFTNRKANG